MTKVVHCKKERYDVYIGRPSKFGNPFTHLPDIKGATQVESREEAVRLYEEYIRNKPELLEDLYELKDQTLGCWCGPKLCHGSILIKLVEEFCKEDKPKDTQDVWDDL